MNEKLSQKDLISALLMSFKISYYDFQEVHGATVTLYKFRPQIGIRVAKIRNLKDELAAALCVPSVRIIAPMDDGSVGIEVPNRERQVLHVGEVLNTWDFQNADMTLPCAIGRTVKNQVFIADLAQMPHLLVAGATGQGKSVGLNVMLLSLLKKKSPDELKLVLIDPKKVELSIYAKLEGSYLACPVITETNEAQQRLDAICKLMDERYDLLAEAGVRNIQEYNMSAECKKLPYIVIVIDEYGDLVMQSGREMEHAICRIAQKARAVGIHMIISTQRPSATIVTGNIKANFPTRIAFRTTTGTDSRVIIDQTGAERLTGRGDMIFFSGADITRIQCAYASISDVIALCDEVTENHPTCEPFPWPLSAQQQKMKIWEELIRREIEDNYSPSPEKQEAERRVKKWQEEREQHKTHIEARRTQLFRHFYGSNTSYMTLLIPHDSKIRGK